MMRAIPNLCALAERVEANINKQEKGKFYTLHSFIED